MIDTRVNYYALAYSIISGELPQKTLARFNIRSPQDHSKKCKYLKCSKQVKSMICDKHMKKTEVMQKLGITRDVLEAALKYENVPDKDYRKRGVESD